MNPKLIKNLKLFCYIRKENFNIWKKAYKSMPLEVKLNFKRDLDQFIKKLKLDLTN